MKKDIKFYALRNNLNLKAYDLLPGKPITSLKKNLQRLYRTSKRCKEEIFSENLYRTVKVADKRPVAKTRVLFSSKTDSAGRL